MHVCEDVPDVVDVDVDGVADVGDSSFWYWRRLVLVQVAPRFFSLSSDDNEPFGWMPNPSISVIGQATDNRKHNRHDVAVDDDGDILDIIALVVCCWRYYY